MVVLEFYSVFKASAIKIKSKKNIKKKIEDISHITNKEILNFVAHLEILKSFGPIQL